MTKTTYLVTGANRGIGFAIVEELSANKDNFIIATARDPSKATALHELNEKNGNIKVVAFEGTGTYTEEDTARNAKFVSDISDYTIDILLVNHGISTDYFWPTASEGDWLLKHFKVNTVSALDAVKLVKPFMEKSSVKKILFTSSSAGRLSEYAPMPLLSYGTSKAALNYLMLSLHAELAPAGFKVASFHPGLVLSDMGNTAVEYMKKLAPTLGLTAEQMLSQVHPLEPAFAAHSVLENVVGPLSADNLNGKFVNYDGTVLTF